MLKARATLLAMAAAVVLAGSANAADLTASLTKGTPELKSAGPLAFGPEGILFVGDTQGAAVFAIATEDTTAPTKFEKFKVEAINEKIANMLGIDAKSLLVNAMATNPLSGNIYFSVSRGTDKDAKPAIVRVDSKGKLSEFSLKDVKFSKASIGNAADGKKRQDAITQVAFVKDRVLVAGLSNENFDSKLRSIPFPFKDVDQGTSVKIYHGAHGRFETDSPVRTFVACEIDGKTNILAAYTCTPLVRIPVSDLKSGEKVQGTTVAELGNMNRPLDMIVYNKDGKEFLLLANSARGVMKIPTEGLDKVEPIKDPIKGGGTGGQGKKIEKIESLKDVVHLDKYGKEYAVALMGKNGPLNLEVIDLP